MISRVHEEWRTVFPPWGRRTSVRLRTSSRIHQRRWLSLSQLRSSHKELLSPLSFLWSFPPFSEPIERIPDPHIINKSRLLNKRLIINVGGVRHEVCFLQVKLVFIHPNHIISRSCGDFFLLCPSPDWASSPGPEHTRRSSRSAATTPSWRTSSSSTDIPDPSTQSSTFTELENCTLPTKCVSLPSERISTIGGWVRITWTRAAMTSSSGRGSWWSSRWRETPRRWRRRRKMTLGMGSLQSTRKWSGTSWRSLKPVQQLRFDIRVLLFFSNLHFHFAGCVCDLNVICGCVHRWNGHQHNASAEVSRRSRQPCWKPSSSLDRDRLHCLVYPRIFS